jgi:hypothetical protein
MHLARTGPLSEPVLEIQPFFASKLDLSAVIIRKDDDFSVGKINDRAAVLDRAQFDSTNLWCMVICFHKFRYVKGPRGSACWATSTIRSGVTLHQ